LGENKEQGTENSQEAKDKRQKAGKIFTQ